MARDKDCNSLSHPRGTDTGRLIQGYGTLTYRQRICPTCGGVQGLSLIRKVR